MARVLLTESNLENIAEAIREKNGEETLYKPREMPDAIRRINTDTMWGEIGGTLSDQTDLQSALDGKVNTETGKGLSTNDYTDAEIDILGALPTAAELTASLDGKVDVVAGKGLSTEDYTTTEKTKLGDLPTSSELNTSLNGKVDKITGKGLSTEDYTTAEKTKLSGLPDGTALASDLATKVDKVSGKGLSTEDYTTAEKTKLTDLPTASELSTSLSGKVDKVTGKGLSTNDYTTAEKNKLSGLPTESELTASLNSKANDSEVVKSVNEITPTNGDVTLNAEDIWAEGVGDKTTSGNPVTVSDALESNAKDLKVTFGPIQDLHGYDHPWPAGGGKNLIPLKAYATTDRGITITPQADGSVLLNGTKTTDSYVVNITEGFTVKANTQYVLSMGGISGTAITDFGLRGFSTVKTINHSEDFSSPGMFIAIAEGETLNNVKVYPQVELGSTATSWEPYSNICPIYPRPDIEIKRTSGTLEQSVTVNLGDNVYGGILDVTNGVLTVTHGYLKLGDLTWNPNGETETIFDGYTTITGKKNGSYNFVVDSLVMGYQTPYNITGRSANNGISVSLPITVAPNINAFNQWMDDNGGYICYELETPTTVTLTPAQISLLEAYNIISTDGDNIDLTYLGTEASNVQEEIDEFERRLHSLDVKLGDVENSIASPEIEVASKNYSAGEYLMLNGQLCKVTSAITTGETIEIGTNVETAEVGEKVTTIEAEQVVQNNNINRLFDVVFCRKTDDFEAMALQIKNGDGPMIYPVGSQLPIPHAAYGNLLFDVVHHITPENPVVGLTLPENVKYGMVLLQHAVIYSTTFDAVEAVYYAEEGLSAGTYNITIANQAWYSGDNGKSFQFTLTKDVPAGGQLYWDGYNVSREGRNITSYASSTSTTAIESVAMTEGSDGTDLGTTNGSGNVNHFHRTVLGSNNYAQSGIRQWLNAEGAANTWWEPTNKWDRPYGQRSRDGYLGGFGEDFRNIILPVVAQNYTNGVYDLMGINTGYTTEDKFFLVANENIGFAKEGSSGIDAGSVFDFYKNATNADRIKYDITNASTARRWWERVPIPSYASGVRVVNTDGSRDDNNAVHGIGAVPACIIGFNLPDQQS